MVSAGENSYPMLAQNVRGSALMARPLPVTMREDPWGKFSSSNFCLRFRPTLWVQREGIRKFQNLLTDFS